MSWTKDINAVTGIQTLYLVVHSTETYPLDHKTPLEDVSLNDSSFQVDGSWPKGWEIYPYKRVHLLADYSMNNQ